MNYITKAIFNLKPNAEFSYQNEDYSTIQWDILDGEAPTQKEIDDEIKRIKAEEIAQEKSKAIAKAALLEKLGITAEEAVLLLS
jgi:hypothetical protein